MSKAVLILSPLAEGYPREIALGAARSFRLHGLQPVIGSKYEEAIERIRDKPLGVVGFLVGPQQHPLLKIGLPAVNISERSPAPDVVSVLSDNEAAGQMAAKHLIERGYRRFIYLDRPTFLFSRRRLTGVRNTLGEKAELLIRTAESVVDDNLIVDFIKSGEGPVGIISADDALAVQTINHLQSKGILLPDQAAMIGFNNDELICESAAPPLSSVDLNPHRLGAEAARLLLRMIAGEKFAPGVAIRIPPKGVEVRASSDQFAISDPWVQEVLNYARDHLEEGLGIEQLAHHFHVSRRTVERRFQNSLGSSAGEILLRLRMERAEWLLSHTHLSLQAIARQSGYNHSHHFGDMFRRRRGITPAEYRRTLA